MTNRQIKQIARLEEIIIAAGFVLHKLQKTYGNGFETGMTEQVSACILDCKAVTHGRIQREVTSKQVENQDWVIS